MAYTTNTLSLRAGQIGGRGPRVWEYFTADSLATVVGAGYISDATKKNMQIGDTVCIFFGTLNTTGPDATTSTHAGGSVSEFAANPTSVVLAVSTISSGAATLLDKSIIGGSATGLVGFYGSSAVSQRANSIQATSVVSAYTATTASALIGALLVEIANTLNGLGLWKGSA